MKKRFLGCALFLGLFTAPLAFAIVDAQLLMGKAWFKGTGVADGSNFGSTNTAAAVHVDPIPLVPVALGLVMENFTVNKNDFAGSDLKSVTISDLALEVYAWLPFVPFLTPYAKVRSSIQSNLVMKFEPIVTNAGDVTPDSIDSKCQMFQTDIGISFSLLPFTKLLIEAGNGTLDAKDFGTEDAKFTFNTVRLGLQVGL